MCNKGFSEQGSGGGAGALGFQGLWGFPVKMKSSLIPSKMSELENAFE